MSEPLTRADLEVVLGLWGQSFDARLTQFENRIDTRLDKLEARFDKAGVAL